MQSPSTQPRISVVVCTRNGWPRIADTLLSLRHQTLAPHQYEVVVVDNASDDGSDAKLERAAGRLRIRLVREPEPGLCAARNRGIAESRAPIVAFIDDDAVAPATHLQRLLRAFRRGAAGVQPGGAGGPLHGLWAHTPPPWLHAGIWRGLSLVSYGPRARILRYPEILLGANMAFRRDVFDRVGTFDTRIGRRGDSLEGGELGDDRELQLRMAMAAIPVLYDPALYVFHSVPAARMEFAYFEKRSRDETYSSALGRIRGSTPEPAGLARRIGRFDRRWLGGALTLLLHLAALLPILRHMARYTAARQRWVREEERRAERAAGIG